MKFVCNDEEIETPRWLERLPNGATVMEYTHLEDGGNGFLPNGIVLAKTSGGMSDVEFVVWTCYYNPVDRKWNCENGDYETSIAKAVANYTRRGGKV